MRDPPIRVGDLVKWTGDWSERFGRREWIGLVVGVRERGQGMSEGAFEVLWEGREADPPHVLPVADLRAPGWEIFPGALDSDPAP